MRIKAFPMHVSSFNATNVVMHNDPKTPEEIVVVNMHPKVWARLGAKGEIIMSMISED